MAETKRRGFLERWALLNLGLLVATFMGVMAYYQNVDQPFADFRLRWGRLAILDFFLVWIPLNGIYILGSLHCFVTSVWSEHRFMWTVVCALSIAWGMVFCGQALR